MKELHEAILTRELDRIGEIVRKECDAGRSEEVRDDILRFSVLAFAPSLHARATMEAARTIAELFDELPDPRPMLVEAARYAAESHVPWGNAPMTEPPPVPSDVRFDDDAIHRAVESGDIREAERWLARVITNDETSSFFDAAARHAGTEGYGFTTAAAAWRTSLRFPPFVRWAVLRTALLEWIQAPGVPQPRGDRSFLECARGEVHGYVNEGGSAERFQTLSLIAAIGAAGDACGSSGRYQELLSRYATGDEGGTNVGKLPDWSMNQLSYRYATDFAMFLRSIPISRRLREVADRATCEKIPAAARRFLNETDGFEKWSFA